MTGNSQKNSQNYPGDDEVLEQLYKKGAKETPPAKLNYEIINYAANPDKSTETPKSVGSHFGGDWKVPLSMAASVVVVFALLVQLDQSPQQLELPPIPEISVPSEDSTANSQPMPDEYNDERNEKLFEAEEALADDISSFKKDRKESDIDSDNSGALIIDKPVTIKKSADKKVQEKAAITRERIQTQPELKAIPSIQAPNPSSTSTITKSKSEQGYVSPKQENLAKPQTAQKQMQAPAKDNLNDSAPDTASGKSSSTSSGAVMQQRSVHERRDGSSTSDITADSEHSEELASEKTEELAEELDRGQTQTESEFSPIPAEDWLLMIEKLVAQKDYAEAARQLTKFKQAHPKVNVEDLDAKIP